MENENNDTCRVCESAEVESLGLCAGCNLDLNQVWLSQTFDEFIDAYVLLNKS